MDPRKQLHMIVNQLHMDHTTRDILYRVAGICSHFADDTEIMGCLVYIQEQIKLGWINEEPPDEPPEQRPTDVTVQ